MDELESKGRKVAIDLVKANIFSLVLMIVAAVVFLVPFFMIWKRTSVYSLMGGIPSIFTVLIAMFAGIAVHELIHGLTWAYFAKSGWQSISFGVIWKMLTPYCHCNEPMDKRSYMWGALMPCIVLGILPSIIALFVGSLPLLAFGIFFIAAAAGDIWMAWLLSKEKPSCKVLDHPSEAGFYVFDEKEEGED